MDINSLLDNINTVANTPPPTVSELDKWWTDGKNGTDITFYIINGVKMTEDEYKQYLRGQTVTVGV